MRKITTLSQGIYDQRAEFAKNSQPLRKEVNVSELEIQNENEVIFKGTRIKMTMKAFKDLMRILKIPTAFIDRYGKILNDKSKTKLINTIKNVMAKSGNRKVTLIVSRDTREIIGIHKTPRNLISNEGFLEIVNRIIDENNLDVINFNVNPNDGGVHIDTVAPGGQFGIDGLKDEHFYSGGSFTNNPQNGFNVSAYINRLVCANGMTTRGFEEQYKLTRLEGDELKKFFDQIEGLTKNGFQPAKFKDSVRDANSTSASLSELYTARNSILRAAKGELKDEELENWVPVKSTEATFHRTGIDPGKLNATQLKNAKVGVSVWDLINGMTHFATHDNGFEIEDYNRSSLQVQAGNMLSKQYDMKNIVSSPF